MSVDNVKKFFSKKGLDYEIIEFSGSIATVELAARALGVQPALIAKTIALKLKDKEIIVVTKGDARIDNKKYRDFFHSKAKMLSPEEVLSATGHPVGGVCPFGLEKQLDIYLDVSLKEFNFVFPAAGSKNSAIKISPDELQQVTSGTWVDVCKT